MEIIAILSDMLMIWSWLASLLLMLAWLGLKFCRVKAPVLRHHVWLVSLLAVAIMPIAGELVRQSHLPLPSSSAVGYAAQAPHLVVDLASQSIKQTDRLAPPIKNTAQLWFPSAVNGARLSMLVAWLAGLSLGATKLIIERVRLRRICRSAKPVSAAKLGIAERHLSNNHAVCMQLSRDVSSPIIYGVFRPRILLPADIAEWTCPAERRAMIEHELAHIERRDQLTNYFQTALTLIFFFHPLVRFACRQLSLERELACDTRVIAGGVSAEIYAEGLLKAVERGLTFQAAHQLNLFSTKEILERRIEMILGSDRASAGAKHWRGMVLAAALITAVACLLITNGVNRASGQEPQSKQNVKLVATLGENKAFDELIEMALSNPNPELQRLATVKLTELEGDGSTSAMVELYEKTSDSEVKIMLIDTLARISEIEPLTKIALLDQDGNLRARALRRIKFLILNSESNDVRNWDVTRLTDQLNNVSSEPPPPLPTSAWSS